MAINNKTIETESEITTTFYGVQVEKDGVIKYINKSYFYSPFACTVKLSGAKRFSSMKTAQKFIDDRLINRDDLTVLGPIEIVSNTKLHVAN